MHEQIFNYINYDAIPYKDHFGEYFNFDINDVDKELLKDFGITIKNYGFSYILASEGNGVLLKELLEVNKYHFTTDNPIQGYFDGKNYYIKLSTFKLIVTNYMRFSKVRNKTKKIEELKELIKKHNLNIEITKYKSGYRADIVEDNNVNMYY